VLSPAVCCSCWSHVPFCQNAAAPWWHLIRQQLADHAGMAAEIAADGVLPRTRRNHFFASAVNKVPAGQPVEVTTLPTARASNPLAPIYLLFA
jgi:hypothetical protein